MLSVNCGLWIECLMRDTYPPTAVRTNLFIYLRGEEERRRGEERGEGERGA